jgi:hypothetical protein
MRYAAGPRARNEEEPGMAKKAKKPAKKAAKKAEK